MTPRIFLAFLLLAAPAGAAELSTAEQIEQCFQQSFPQSSSIQTVTLEARDRIGAVTASEATLYWKDFDGLAKVAMRFAAPAELRGAALLMIEKKDRNDMFIYLPQLAHTKRITSRMTSSSMFGTDFSYEEFERLQGIAANAPSSRLEDSEVEGRPAYVLEVRPREEDDSAYERILDYIDRETCVSLRAEFYERGDKPRKILSADISTLAQQNGVWVLQKMKIEDLRDGTDTVLSIQKIQIDAPITRATFSQKWLETQGR